MYDVIALVIASLALCLLSAALLPVWQTVLVIGTLGFVIVGSIMLWRASRQFDAQYGSGHEQ